MTPCLKEKVKGGVARIHSVPKFAPFKFQKFVHGFAVKMDENRSKI